MIHHMQPIKHNGKLRGYIDIENYLAWRGNDKMLPLSEFYIALPGWL